MTGISIPVFPGTWKKLSSYDWYKHSCISRNLNRVSSESSTAFNYMLDVPGSNLCKFILYPDKAVINVKTMFSDTQLYPFVIQNLYRS